MSLLRCSPDIYIIYWSENNLHTFKRRKTERREVEETKYNLYFFPACSKFIICTIVVLGVGIAFTQSNKKHSYFSLR